jgi:hypothetical protein
MTRYVTLILCLAGCAAPTPAPTWQDGSHVHRLVDSLANLHMKPIDRWLEAGTGYERIPADREVHYALVIVPEDKLRAPTLVYRMSFRYEIGHYDAHHWSEAEPWVLLEESLLSYIRRKVDAVRMELKSDLIDAYLKNDPERIETLTFGTGYFVRMPTEHSDPAKMRPEDVVRR